MILESQWLALFLFGSVCLLLGLLLKREVEILSLVAAGAFGLLLYTSDSVRVYAGNGPQTGGSALLQWFTAALALAATLMFLASAFGRWPEEAP